MSPGAPLKKQPHNQHFLIFAAIFRPWDCPLATQEGAMHIHGNSMAVNATDFYSATQKEKAAAAKRAAIVRKKLVKTASEIETPEETLLISQWVNSQHSQVESGEQNYINISGKDPDLG
jgi:hypothetical protein